MNIQMSIDPSVLNETQIQCFITFVQSFLDVSPQFTKTWNEYQLEEKLAKVTASL